MLRDTEGAQHGERAAGEAAAPGRGAAPDVLDVQHLQRGAGRRGIAVGGLGLDYGNGV